MSDQSNDTSWHNLDMRLTLAELIFHTGKAITDFAEWRATTQRNAKAEEDE